MKLFEELPIKKVIADFNYIHSPTIRSRTVLKNLLMVYFKKVLFPLELEEVVIVAAYLPVVTLELFTRVISFFYGCTLS